MHKSNHLLFILFSLPIYGIAQENADTTSTSNLNEAIITSYQKNVKIEGAITTVQIKNTPFAQIGNLQEMLAQIPGIRNSQLGIEVSGYGKPRIYIDGREVKNEEELRTISSEQIKNLKINKAPGAEYEANTPAIIQIATIKSVADYLFMNIGNTMGMRRKFSESPFVLTRFQIGKMASSFYYDFNRSGSLVKETYFRNIMRPNDTFKSEQKRELPFYDTYHSFSWSGDYTINKKNRLGFFYFFNHDNYAGHERGTDWSQSALGTQTKWIDRQSVQITNLHSATALYDFITDKYSIHASQDYAFSTTNSNLNASEHTNNKQSVVKSINNRDYHVLTSNLYNSFRVGKKSIGLVGGKYTLIKSSSRIGSDEFLPSVMQFSRIKVSENTPQVFATLYNYLGPWTITPGVRYEFMHRSIQNISSNGETSKYSDRVSNFYPYLTISYQKNKWNAYLQYSRSNIVPNFSMLNSGIIYQDSLTYTKSNPLLKTAYVDRVQGSVSYQGFSFTMRYRHTKNPIVSVEIPSNPTSFIVYSTNVNLDKYQETTFNISYSSNIKKLDYYLDFSLNLPYAKILVGESMKTRKKPFIDAEVNLTYAFNQRFSLYTKYVLQGKRDIRISHQKAVHNWDFGFTGKWLKDKLSLTLEATDILGKDNYNNITDTYGFIQNGTYGTSDMRGIRLSIRYTLFNKPISVSAQRANAETLMRIQ